MWEKVVTQLHMILPRAFFGGDLQDALWAPVNHFDRAAWSLVALFCLIGAVAQARLLLSTKVDAVGLARIMVFMGQVMGVTLAWTSGSLWYCIVLYSAGNALASVLIRANWCQLRGSFMHRLGMAIYVIRHFDDAHPLAVDQTMRTS